MTNSPNCPACGTPITQGSSGDLCPACLLQAAMGGDSTLDEASGEGSAAECSPATPEQPGTRIGHYKLLEQIGEGGFGVVWMAEQEEPVRRRVALKIIKLGMDTREVVARFEAERQALAMMEHPNIASVFDGGATATGRPYFVMELVKGVPITTYCDANQLTTQERLELFMEVCHAVQHAHQKGVIHRDLKPSNILVTFKEDHAVPKVIDFGIAKATQATLTEKTLFTRLNQWIGTPEYMSPEQAGLGSLDVDTRSDIYSLGVLLYELLTGRPPFDPEKLLAAGYDAVMRVIREEEPPKPSTRLSTMAEEELTAVAAKRGAEPAKLNRLVRGDLDWIVMKALEKDRRRRYETANGFADDLRRHLDNEVVLARSPGTAYRIKRFIARNRMVAGFSSALLLTLLAGTIISSWQAWRAWQSSREADIQRQIANSEADRAMRLAEDAASARKVAEEENAGRKRQLREAARSDRLQAMELFELDRDADAFAHLARACDYDPESSLAAEMAILRLNVLSVARQVCILRGINPFPLEPLDRSVGIQPRSDNGDNRIMHEAAFTPDGRQVATRRLWAKPDLVQLWDAVTGRKLRDLPVNVTNNERGVWRKLPGLEVDGTYLSFNYPWEVAVKEDEPMPSPDGMTELAFKQEGTVLRRKTTPDKGFLLAGPNYDWHFPARFAPDGLQVATATEDHRVVLYHAPSGKAIAVCPGHAEEVNEVRFSANSASMVTASSDTTARVWEVADRRLLDKFEGPGKDVLRDMLHSVKFTPDDRLVIGDTPDKWLFTWDSLTGELFRGDAVLTGDGERIGASSDGTLYILRQGAEGQAGAVRVWDAVNRRELARLGERDLSVDQAAFSPDDRLLATHERDGIIRVWNVREGRQISELPTAMKTINMLLFSPDSRCLAVFHSHGLTPSLLLEVGSGRILCEFPTHGEPAMEASFSPAGNLLAVSGGVDDPVTRVWECPGGRLLATLPGAEGRAVTTVEFSPDGTLLATAIWESTSVQVWRVNNWRRIDFTANPPIYLMDGGVVFSPDSRLLLASGEGGRRLLLWESRSGESLANLKIPDGYLLDQAFSHDGKRIVGIWKTSNVPQASGGPVVLAVPMLDAPVPGWFSDFLRFLLQRTISSEGRRRVLTPIEWEEFRDRVSAAAAADQSRYGELARWFLVPADQRPVRPGAAMTRHELADRLITPAAGPVQLQRVLAFDPANPLAHLALARFEENPKVSEFLRQWAHEHLPARPGPELQRRIDTLDALNGKR